MIVGIDAVVLGAWTNLENCENILDIGTGTGLIALMVAQRSSALIDAIDIDFNAITQAQENITTSPWNKRIKAAHISLQKFTPTNIGKYDLIISNPPYFINSTKTPDNKRTSARHTDTLSHSELIQNSKILLKPKGRICYILPVNEGLQCIKIAYALGLYNSKRVFVFPKPNTIAKRILLEFILEECQTIDSELFIESEIRHQYTEEFSELVKSYYLNL